MAEPISEMKPFLRKGEELIAGLWNGEVNMTAKEYHTARDGIMKMRATDPAMSALYDKYLTDVVKGRKDMPADQIQKLSEGFKKQNLTLSQLVNDVGFDLKSHGYSASYRPPVVINVNGRPMHPEIVATELKGAGVQLETDIPRSKAPGQVTTSGLSVKQSSLAEGLDEAGRSLRRAEDVHLKLGKDSVSIIGQAVEHSGGLMKLARAAPIVGKIIGVLGAASTVLKANAAPTSEIRNDILFRESAALLDPTNGILSEGVPAAMRDIRENGARRAEESRTNPHNLAITRQENFLLSADHPAQLGALKINDANGKMLDVEKLLKDADGQKLVLSEIQKRAEKADTPESKELFKNMKEAAEEFVTLEGRRKTIQTTPQNNPVAQAPVQPYSMAPAS